MANKSSYLDLDYAKYDFKDTQKPIFKSEKGLSRETVEQISDMKKEPEWMKKFRLRAYEHFIQRPMPTWGGNLSHIDFNDIYYYLKPTDKVEKSWDDVPEKIKKTFDRLGIPEAEKKFLAGVGAQYESEVVYHSLLKHLEDKGVIFCDTDTALKLHPEIVKKYFGTIIPPEDNKMAALNSAVWSGGSFIYIPPGVKVELPLQAYFRINAANMGQFERTLIIADDYADMQYIEGCTAPVYSTDSLHSAVVEIIAKKGAKVRYTTLQNWSSDVYNLVTKRAYAYEDSSVEWIDANVGSKLTMKYPSVYLVGPRAKAEIVSVAFAGKNRHQDRGLSTYRGLVHVAKGAVGVKSSVRCDALLMDDQSKTTTYPYMEVNEDDATITHEATVGRINEDQLFYLMSRGLSETQALSMIVTGFMEPFTRVLPMEYAVEFNRLIEMEMEGAVG